VDYLEFRRQDYSLDQDQEAVRDAFADFFVKESPSSVVRAAEPVGFDKSLWSKLVGMGVTAMALPVAVGGDDATLIDLVLIAEEYGRSLAPVPFVAHVVATRLLVAAGAAAETVAAAIEGERTFTLALQPHLIDGAQLVPDAAISADVLDFDGNALTLHSNSGPVAHVANQGSSPLGWWNPASAAEHVVLAEGGRAAALYEAAVIEWKLLTAAALTGLTEAALQPAVEFSKTRETMGVPIGALQGVAFPLTDIAIDVVGGRNMVWKSAWMIEHQPGVRPELPLLAFAKAARTATGGTTVAAHLQGGLGFTEEADASLYFLRAKGWSLLAGDPTDDLKKAGSLLARQA
jgi:alkylation response protein AidB-like acyl-CoA dehydrogenase